MINGVPFILPVSTPDLSGFFGPFSFRSIDSRGEITGGVLTGSANFSGVGYGVGVVQLVDRNVFLKAEIQQISYESKVVSGVTYQPSSTVGTVGIGYKF